MSKDIPPLRPRVEPCDGCPLIGNGPVISVSLSVSITNGLAGPPRETDRPEVFAATFDGPLDWNDRFAIAAALTETVHRHAARWLVRQPTSEPVHYFTREAGGQHS